MIEVKTIESKVTPKKKNVNLKNISLEYLKFIDIETGEDQTGTVLAEIPEGIEAVNFKLTFELPDEDESEDDE